MDGIVSSCFIVQEPDLQLLAALLPGAQLEQSGPVQRGGGQGAGTRHGEARDRSEMMMNFDDIENNMTCYRGQSDQTVRRGDTRGGQQRAWHQVRRGAIVST